ncbi:DUF1491 family protein [Marinibaculum pumilum]|uniref:DUF1491 family protein n=1 Tax=Marinibaculum pumilum TaxID=1766165 RepID=A0ABV7L242_9PROT
MEYRLKTHLWVNAMVRLHDRAAIPIAILHRGDEDAGGLMIKQDRRGRGICLWTQARDPQGRLTWIRPHDGETLEEADCAARIERALKRDPDLWVIEVEDRDDVRLFAQPGLF